MPDTLAAFLKLCFHAGMSSSIIHTAVDDATMATRLLLTKRWANMMTAWSTKSRIMPLTADFIISFRLNRHSPRSPHNIKRAAPATLKRIAPSTNGGKSRRHTPMKK